MKTCPTCGKIFSDSVGFCETCGTQLVDAAEEPKPVAEGKKRLPVWAIILIVVLLLAIAVLGTVLVMNRKNGAEVETSTVPQMEVVTSAQTSAVAQRTEPVSSSALVYPSSGERVTPFAATVVCNERNQKFLKMRCGPSKSGYDTVKDRNGNEIHIPNYTVVTIESNPVSRGGVSWSFAAYTYQGQTYHGWIRTDFIP